MDYDGWIKLWRKGFFEPNGIFNNFGNADEPWDKFHAWCYLLCEARYDPEPTMTTRGQPVVYGTIVTSEAELSRIWHWNSRKRVRTFIRALERTGMCTTNRTANGTTLTIENYGKYQSGGTSKRPTEGTSMGTSRGTSMGTSTGTHNKNIRKKKEEGEERAGAREAPPGRSLEEIIAENDARREEMAARIKNMYQSNRR